jgi:hypothetical protein
MENWYKMEKTGSLQKIKYAFLTIVFLELFLGGTGRLVEFTSFLTLRMCLFLIYMGLIIIYLLIKRPLPVEVIVVMVFFLLLNVLSSIIGYVDGGTPAAIFEDVKPLLNTFLLCYLAFSVKTASDIRYLLTLLKISAVLLTIFHLVLYCIFLKYSDIAILYSAINSAESNNTVFLFKGESGFVNYTGDIYLCVGFIVWEQYTKNSWFKLLALLLIAIAIVLTGTRGLIVALAAVYFVKWLLLKFNYKSLIYISFGIVIVLAVYLNIKDNIGDKVESDETRYEQIDEVKERITPLSFVIGHGYGVGVPIRPIHMEISFLEIFHKQGIIGLTYYSMVLLIAYLAYKRSGQENSMGLYMCVLFIFFVSTTNPYVNHPLGITVIAIAIISMLKLRELEKTGKVSLLKIQTENNN